MPHTKSPYRVVVVTGASSGLGRAIAHEFARNGASLGLIAREPEALERTAAEVEALGPVRALALPADMADAGQVEAAARRVEEELGPIDVWVNNAMTTVFSPFIDMTPEEFRRVTDVTYHGYVHGTLAALTRMKLRDRGVIVQVGSALAYRAIPLQSAYCGAKFAIRGFTDSIRCELLHDKSRVHITMVQMPAINTTQFDWCRNKLTRQSQPVPPVYTPELCARAVEWSARHRRRELTVGFSSFKAIWGNKFLPGFIDRLLAGPMGFEGQMRAERKVEGQEDNLFNPVHGHHAMHGPFHKGARSHSLQLDLDTHPRLSLLGLAALGGFLLGRRK